MYKETLDFFERQPAPGTEELKMQEDVHCVPTKKKKHTNIANVERINAKL